MPVQPIPFAPNQQSGLDVLNASVALAINVIIDKAGTVRKRPGIAAYAPAGSAVVDAEGISALHATSAGAVYAVGGGSPARSLYRLVGGTAVNMSPSSAESLLGSERPVVAETEAMLVIAGGGAVQRVLLADDTSERLPGSPPIASHVIANASRLLLNNLVLDRGLVSYSEPASGSSTAGHEIWSGGDSGFFSGEARPDPVVALGESTNEIFAFGTTTVQAFIPDAESVYSPVSTKEYGCIAPYSVVKVDQSFIWLDHRRRIVASDGRAFEVVSGPIQQTLDDMEEVSDAFGYRVVHGPVDAVVWTFPSDGRTFVYQVGGGWSQWSSFQAAVSNDAQFAVTAHANVPTTGENVVGLESGEIGLFTASATTDLGSPIVARVETGCLNRGSDFIKHSKCVRLALRRGAAAAGSDEPVGLLSWRDDEGAWSPAIPVGFGSPGETYSVVQIHSLGTYRRRQWRFEFGEDSTFVLASATEEFDVIEE